jgi:SAM-dependent methyltransferase
MSLFTRIADHRNPNSVSSQLRRRRLAFFQDLLDQVPRPVSILDVGGTAAFWSSLQLDSSDVSIILLNVRAEKLEAPHLRSIVGDARDLSAFPDQSVDIVYSNSVIEHVGTLEDQLRMAREIRRVGKRYFVQTPNAFFPIEPHFLVPGYQFMPLTLRTLLLTKFRLGWKQRERDWQKAKEIAGSVRLMTEAEIVRSFPGATLHREWLAGMVKSLIAYHGW